MPNGDPFALAHNTLQKLYQELDKATTQALEKYPEIQCTSGCSQCCQNYGSPLAAQVEWHSLRQYWPELPKETRTQILNNYQKLKDMLRQRLLRPGSEIASALFHTPCPFLIEDKCSVYAHRPLSCRAFGLSQHGPAEASLSERIFACGMEIERWEKSLPMHPAPDLPLQQTYFNQLNQIDPRPLRTLLSYLDQEIRHGQLPD